MTTHQKKRCQHCGRRYSFQGSGYGCGRKENSSKYCPTCNVPIQEAIAAAKAKIPVLFVERWVETDEVSVEVLMEERDKRLKLARKYKTELVDKYKSTDSEFGKAYNSFAGIDIKAKFGEKELGTLQRITYFVERIWSGQYKFNEDKELVDTSQIVQINYEGTNYQLTFWNNSSEPNTVKIKKWIKA